MSNRCNQWPIDAWKFCGLSISHYSLIIGYNKRLSGFIKKRLVKWIPIDYPLIIRWCHRLVTLGVSNARICTGTLKTFQAWTGFETSDPATAIRCAFNIFLSQISLSLLLIRWVSQWQKETMWLYLVTPVEIRYQHSHGPQVELL